MTAGTLCVVAKTPVRGCVKTRLAARIGPRRATSLARAFLADTWASAARLPARAVLVLDGDPALPYLRPPPEIWDQGGGDLGARLERAFARALAAAPWCIAIGSDSPGLPARLLRRGIELLEAGRDAVIGPCEDGGFYLLGLRRCPPGLLAGLPWSAAETGERTVARLRDRGLAPEALDRWYDVDRPADLARLREDLTAARVVAPATRRALDGLDLSVILPVLDEQARIERRLDELARLDGVDEILVVDGGSRDRTRQVVRAHGAARLLSAARGRASQMNAGARAATGQVLLFLHADVSLPSDAVRWIHRTLGRPGNVAGAFRTWTVPDGGAPPAPWLHLADLRSRYTSLPYGDQALFVRAGAFDDAGGFPDLPLMEDLELSGRLRARGRIVTVPARVRVSGRRFLAHPVRDTVLVNVLPLLYRMGVRASRLARWYDDVR